MTITKPDRLLTFADIPPRVPGAAKYMPGARKVTDKSIDIIMQEPDGHCSVIDSAPNEQSAFRKAIRWQKRENAAVNLENVCKATAAAFDSATKAAEGFVEAVKGLR